MNKPVERWSGWHFLADSKSLRDGTLARVGRIERVEGPLELCKHGLHASARIVDALKYAPGYWLSRVELIGTRVNGDDKSCAMVRKRLTIINAERMLHEFALWCAHRALTAERAAGREPDPRSWEALRVKRLWLDGKATDEELDAARRAALAAAWCAARRAPWRVAESAAWSAAWSAARRAASDAAESAAWSAARSAAWRAAADASDAAWSAARSAAWRAAADASDAAAWRAAGAAARNAERAAQERWLRKAYARLEMEAKS